jgi:hypothetical protein
MPVVVRGKTYDTMGEACRKLGIGKTSMLRYLRSGFFTQPLAHPQGLGKKVRLFTADWYGVNIPRLKAKRQETSNSGQNDKTDSGSAVVASGATEIGSDTTASPIVGEP